MTETTNPESGQESVNPELPTPKFTETSAASPTSSVDTEALTEAILKRLEPVLDKKLQSTKDKRIANIEKQLGIRDLEELEALGATIPENVKLEHRLRQLEGRGTSEAPTQTPTSQGSGANLTAQDVSEVVKQYQLDANDADVIEKLRGTYRNRDHFENTLAQMALARINKPTGSAADSTTISTSTTPVTKTDINVLTSKLAELQKFPTKNREEIKKLKTELEARDWK